MPTSIFVSYSHQDAGLVQPVVGLLRATEDVVFQDLDSIKPGRRWRREIEEALYAAQLIILFWCYHSSHSTEVRKEYELALTTGKNVLPVLLDATPLPEELHEFQWVDLRQLVTLVHRSTKRRVIPAVMVVLMVGSTLLSTAEWSLPLLESPESLPISQLQQMSESSPAVPAAPQTLKSPESLSLSPALEPQQRAQPLEREPQPLERERARLWQELQRVEQQLWELRRGERRVQPRGGPEPQGEPEPQRPRPQQEQREPREQREQREQLEQQLRELRLWAQLEGERAWQRALEREQLEQQLREQQLEELLPLKEAPLELEPLELKPLSQPWPWRVAATLVFLLALLTLSVRILTTRKARHQRTTATPTEYQQQMAEKLQAELFSRGIGSV